MLYVYFGSDISKVREAGSARARALASEGSAIDRIGAEDYRTGIFTERAGSTSLFGTDAVTVLDMLSENAEAFTALMEDLSILAESSQAFVVVESGLLAADKKAFQKHAAAYEEHTAEKKERFNTFALTDALLERDKKSLWLLLGDALRAGSSYEEIIGILFWQVKSLRLVMRTPNAEEAGLKPFVYSKSKRALSKFTRDELDRMSRELLSIYHDGHLGKSDIGLALEKWILAV